VRSADITFVVLTKDEARNIAECLGSLPDGAQAIVYDAMSEDDTAARARALGATVVQAPWAGYVAARAAAAQLVSTQWTFMLDADERLTIALRKELEALAPASEIGAYSVPRRNWFCGHWIRCAGWWPDRLVRLFRTGHARVVAKSPSSGAQIHETWMADGACGALQAPLEHYSYPTLDDYRRKFEQYTEIEARALPPSLPGFLRACLVAPARWLWFLFGRGGFSQGWRGFYVCAASAAYPVAVQRKALRRGRVDEPGPGKARS
jgi:glycosyltransferase involved in cell wall biosynthesis